MSRRTSIFPLLWAMLFDHTSLNITFPILTLLFFDTQSHLFAPDTSYAERSLWYGLCVALPHIINIIAAPVLSALSDEFGRKKMLLLGTFGAFLFALTAALGIMWGMLSLLFMGRLIQGLFSRTNPIAQAVIGDVSTKKNKVLNMGYLQLIISIGAFVGPIIGGYFANRFWFNQLNFSLPYFIAALLGAVSCILTWVFFEETLKKNTFDLEKQKQRLTFKNSWLQFKKIMTHSHVISISIILLLVQVSWSIYYQFTPPVLKILLGFDAHRLGFFVGLIALWLALATGFGIKILGYFFTFPRMLFISLCLVLAGLLLNILFCTLHLTGHWTLLIWFAAIPTAMGDVIAYSCITALYSNVVAENEQGKVMAICSTIVAVVWSLTGLLGGLMMSVYSLLPLIIAPIGVLLAIIFLYVGDYKFISEHFN